jgi:hypothetical protein
MYEAGEKHALGRSKYLIARNRLSHRYRNHADTVERRAIDQLRTHDGIDQHVLLWIDGPVDLERLEEQRG